VKLVHLVGFIVKKFVTMHGHMNVKFGEKLLMRKESELVRRYNPSIPGSVLSMDP